MKPTNRFISLFEQLGEHTPLTTVFGESLPRQSDEIIEAMYVISERRSHAGHPVELVEIFDAIPEILTDADLLDAAVDVCLQNLMAEGMSEEGALNELLKTNPSLSDQINAYSDISSVVSSAIKESGRWMPELPALFGTVGKDGKQRYELRRVIGSGSQGTMYEAVDRLFGEDGQPSLVALKVFHTTEDAEVCRAEGARARRVRHPNIAQVIDCRHDDDGDSYVAYELIQGQSLEAWVRNHPGKPDPRECCRVVGLIARGIESAHSAGVVHCDLKPSNILMTHDNQPRVTDFGIARSTLPTTETALGVHGSLAFMAPEQYRLNSNGTMPSVDIYALGGLLYWLLTGKFPNGETVAGALECLKGNEQDVGGREYEGVADQRLIAVVERALCKDLADRYGSAAQFAQDIETYLDKSPIAWLDRSWAVQTRLFAKRNPIVVLLNIGLMILIGLVVAVWASAQSRIEFEQAQSQAALEMQIAESQTELLEVELNNQIAIEQDRVRQLRERNLMGKNMLDAWSETADNHEDDILATANMLFLYTMSTSGFWADDPEFSKKMLLRRVEIAEGYLATLTPANSSPIKRAQWHEMLGVWYGSKGSLRAQEHFRIAEELILTYAPEDTLWLEQIRNPYLGEED